MNEQFNKNNSNKFTKPEYKNSIKSLKDGDYFDGNVKILRKIQPGPVIFVMSDGEGLIDGVIKSSNFEVDDVVIECLSDTNYPEGGSVDKTKVDMCSDCFINKLLPWLESLGCKSRTEELDW